MSILCPCLAAIDAGPDPLAHYVIVRGDLPPGSAAAQIIHAAGESSPGNLPEGTYAVALVAKDEAQLQTLAVRLQAAGVSLRTIRESDPPYSGQLMALGLTPMPKSRLYRLLSSLPLYKGGAPVKQAA